jgi:hypothetical protein
MRARLEHARNQHQFKAADIFRDATLMQRKFGGLAWSFGKGAPIVTARNEVFTGCQRTVEMIGEEVNG